MFIDCHAVIHLPLVDCHEVFSIAECLNPYLFQINVTLLLYNMEPIRKAQTSHKKFSFIVLSFKRLKYEIKHENFGQIYWFLV